MSYKTFGSVGVDGRLGWLVDYISSWGTTRTETYNLWEMGPFLGKIW